MKFSGQAFSHIFIDRKDVNGLHFSLLASDEIRRMSVAEIKNERIYSDTGLPNFHGILDPRMGVLDKDLKCIMCKGSSVDCPGHFGHIELARPVFHAGLLDYVKKLLKCICFNCSKVLAPRDKLVVAKILKVQSKKQRFNRVYKLCESVKKCEVSSEGCGHIQPKFTKEGLRISVLHQDENYDQAKDRKQFLQAEEALKIFQRIKEADMKLLGFDVKDCRPENMIIRNLAVCPPQVRPSVAMTSSLRSEDDLTYSYQKIVLSNNQLLTQIQKGANTNTIQELRQALQYYVATLMNNEIAGQPVHKHKSGKALKALRSRLKGKEGRLRGNLMGKRVDFSARTVITPDPILELDQLGVPLHIAHNLTIPETVTTENMDEMRQLIQNGPCVWPGAKYIMRHDNKQIDLSAMRNRSDAHLEPGYKVERHIRNGDYVIFNRQPSLHKMSVMGHRVKVLPYSTFRLNLSVTTPYNADFDGDEMNMHVPQSWESMAEVKEIIAVPHQIISPQSNKPVMGIVQDSLLGVMLFTMKDTILEKDQVMQLAMWFNHEGPLPIPAVLKPKVLWTGKQIFSLIIPDVNLQRYGSSETSDWASYGDKNIFISKGELLCGVINKGIVGNSSGGLVHIIWKDKGPLACKNFLSQVQLVVNNWLYNHGFSVGVQDIIAKQSTLSLISKTLTDCKKNVNEILKTAQLGKLKQQPGKSMMESFEAQVNQTLNAARDKSGNLALHDLQSFNNLKAMVSAGSKGSDLNISQIMACVGQQNVEGKRITFGFSRRTLPHFSKDDFGPDSRGFVEHCYLNGLTPSEFYFHAMGGREGVIDTAVKTADTGYIQRRLIKALEDVMVKYDGTVRTSSEQVVQFLYGEDGMAGEYIEDMNLNLLKIDNQQCEKKFRFMPSKMRSTDIQEKLSESIGDQNIVKEVVNDPNLIMALEREYQQIEQNRRDLRSVILKSGEELVHLPVNVQRVIWNAKEKFNVKQNSKSDLHPKYVLEQVQELMQSLRVIPGIMKQEKESILQESHRNSTWLFRIYLSQLLSTKQLIQVERMSRNAFDFLLGEIKAKFEQSQVCPGEMVGSIGAQSIGEPATQMTLNTFHFAGVSAKNVTLGVPRLKEIINVATHPKTPSMRIYLTNNYRKKQKTVTKFGGKIEHTTLHQVIKSTQIYYDPDPKTSIVKDDEALMALYHDVPMLEDSSLQSRWLLRMEFDNERMHFKDVNMTLVEKKISDIFGDQISVMRSDDNAEKMILRLRVNDIEDDEDETVCSYLKEFEDKLLHEVTLKGFHEIPKVTFTKYMENEYDPTSGAFKISQDNWMIETDGVALQKVLGIEKVDSKKTISNSLIEILQVLGIEATRQSLINELRFVLGSYGIYVNYRHLSTLCDVMTQRGVLTAVTRHGINRIDNGVLRKCSFEETVEILLEAAVFSEYDGLRGITENLIFGNLAPFGTGCFDLVMDSQVLDQYAQDKMNEELVMEQEEEEFRNQVLTPYLQLTPRHQQFDMGNQSVYSASCTPDFQGQMSPNDYMVSPHPYSTYLSPGASPSYRAGPTSPMYSSPLYKNMRSPIYQVNSSDASPGVAFGSSAEPLPNSPAYYVSSPSYNPQPSSSATPQNSQESVRYSPMYSPSSMAASQQYSPNAQSPYQNRTPYSPSYSYAQSYTSPSQQMTSPRYSIQNSQSAASPHQMYVPQSPAYLPMNSAEGAMHEPAYSPYSSIKEEDKEEE